MPSVPAAYGSVHADSGAEPWLETTSALQTYTHLQKRQTFKRKAYL